MSWDQPISSEELQGMYDRALAWHGMPSMGPNQSWDEYLQALAQPRQGVEYYPATYFRQQNSINDDYERYRLQGINHEQAAMMAQRNRQRMGGGMPTFSPEAYASERISELTSPDAALDRYMSRYDEKPRSSYDSRMRAGWQHNGGGQSNIPWQMGSGPYARRGGW